MKIFENCRTLGAENEKKIYYGLPEMGPPHWNILEVDPPVRAIGLRSELVVVNS